MEISMEQVVNVIEQALNMASTKGAFGLKDSAVINQALEALKNHFADKKQTQESDGIVGEMIKEKAKK